jgi:glucan-binding YG repeat protein
MNGGLYYSINGVLKTGWQDVNGKYCYAGVDYKLYVGEKSVSGITYLFNEDGVTSGAWVTASDGKLKYSYGPNFYPYGWQEIDGEQYFFGTKFDGGYAYTGVRSSPINPNSLKAGINWYEFASDGKYIRDIKETGIFTDSLTYVTCYLIEGETQMTGLTKIGNDYYYLSTSNGEMAINVTRQVAHNRIDESAKDRFTETATFTFGADGKMVIEEDVKPEEPAKKNGIIDGYYYINDVIQKTGLTKIGNDYYYFSTTDGKMAVNVTRQVAHNRIDESAKDRFTETATFTFGADGKMVMD